MVLSFHARRVKLGDPPLARVTVGASWLAERKQLTARTTTVARCPV